MSSRIYPIFQSTACTQPNFFFSMEMEDPPDPLDIADHVMIAKILRVHGIRTSFNNEGEFGIVKPTKDKEVEMIRFHIEEGKLFCTRGLAYDLGEPRSLKFLIKSLKFCSEHHRCTKPCLFGE